MSTVAFVVHSGRLEAIEAASRISRQLRERGVTTRHIDGEPVDAVEATSSEGLAAGADLVVSVGGDGTLLRAAQIAHGASCPLIGVKVGRLGFLTETLPEEALAVIDEVLSGTARIEERSAVIAESETWNEPQWALNEVIVEKSSRHRLIRLAVRVDETDVCTFSADGVIVASSTGSTAYSFAARGPIVSPMLDCLVVTPVAAHMVFDRSLVLAPTEQVTLEVVGDEPAVLSADGHESVELPVGTRVRISVATKRTLMVRPTDGESFFSIVREKFGLPGGAGRR